jgi:hypothetical protein
MKELALFLPLGALRTKKKTADIGAKYWTTMTSVVKNKRSDAILKLNDKNIYI